MSTLNANKRQAGRGQSMAHRDGVRGKEEVKEEQMGVWTQRGRETEQETK